MKNRIVSERFYENGNGTGVTNKSLSFEFDLPEIILFTAIIKGKDGAINKFKLELLHHDMFEKKLSKKSFASLISLCIFQFPIIIILINFNSRI